MLRHCLAGCLLALLAAAPAAGADGGAAKEKRVRLTGGYGKERAFLERLEEALWEQVKPVSGYRPGLGVGRADLDGDGTDELLVVLGHVHWCGGTVWECPGVVLRRRGEEWFHAGDFVPTPTPEGHEVRVPVKAVNGWRPIRRRNHAYCWVASDAPDFPRHRGRTGIDKIVPPDPAGSLVPSEQCWLAVVRE